MPLSAPEAMALESWVVCAAPNWILYFSSTYLEFGQQRRDDESG